MNAAVPSEPAVLSSWKDIARYLGKGVRTVQRWEHHLGLPVRRPTGVHHKSAVLLDRGELDAWMAARFSVRAREKDATAKDSSNSPRSDLREGIRTARELRLANHALAEQISESIRTLAARCDLLATRSLQVPWSAIAPAAPQPGLNPGTGLSEPAA